MGYRLEWAGLKEISRPSARLGRGRGQRRAVPTSPPSSAPRPLFILYPLQSGERWVHDSSLAQALIGAS